MNNQEKYNIRLKPGKTYKMKHPRGDYTPTTIHIDYVLEDPTMKKYKDNSEYNYYLLIVYRVWSKHKRHWKHYIEPYYAFCMFNHWPEYKI